MPNGAGLSAESTEFADVDLHALLTNEFIEPEEKPAKKTEAEVTTTETPEEESKPAPTQEKESEEPTAKATEEDTKSTEEVEGSDDVSEESTLVEDLAKAFGYEDLLEEGRYTDDMAGVTQFVEDAAIEFARAQVDEHFGQFPDVAQYYQFRAAGGKPEEFFRVNHPAIDYKSLEIADDDIATQRSLITQNLKNQGIDDETIKSALTAAEAGGTLKNYAEVARSALANQQERAKADFKQRQQDLLDRQIAEERELKQDVTAIVSKGAIAGLQIPKKVQDDFIKFVLDPVQQGQTGRDLAAAKATLEQELLMSWILFNNYDISKFIALEAQTANARSLKDRLRQQQLKDKSKTKRSSDATPTSNDTEIHADEVDLDALYNQAAG